MDMCIYMPFLWISCRQLYIQHKQIQGINFLLFSLLTSKMAGAIIRFVGAISTANEQLNHDN